MRCAFRGIGSRLFVFYLTLMIGVPGCSTSMAEQASASMLEEDATEIETGANPALNTPSITPAITEIPTPFPSEASSDKAPQPFFGVETDNLESDTQLRLLSELGVTWIRRNALVWSFVEPVEGERNWSVIANLERDLQEAAEQGLQVILIVRGTPSWAQLIPGSSCGPIQPEKIDAFACFMRDAVARYSQPPFNIHHWEIWNEPDVDAKLVPPHSVFGGWGDESDPYYGGERFAAMLERIYPAIKVEDPAAQVLIGGLLLDCDPINPPDGRNCLAARFLEGILESGGGSYFDGVAFHSYDHYYRERGKYGNPGWNAAWNISGPVHLAKARYIRFLLEEYGLNEKSLWNTETALLCGATGFEPYCITSDFSQTKANYLIQSYLGALEEGFRVNIWYSLEGWRASGLVRWRTQANTAYRAYQTLIEHVEGANLLRHRILWENVQVYEFERAGRSMWILWTMSEEERKMDLDREPMAVLDLYGNPLPMLQELIVSDMPIYVYWE